MSLSDGFKANHGENGFLGVTEEDFGVYYREETRQKPERVVLIDMAGAIVDEKELSNGKSEAVLYIDDEYNWADIAEDARE